MQPRLGPVCRTPRKARPGGRSGQHAMPASDLTGPRRQRQSQGVSSVDLSTLFDKLDGFFSHAYFGFAGTVFCANLLGDLHGAELRPAHGAEMSSLCIFVREG